MDQPDDELEIEVDDGGECQFCGQTTTGTTYVAFGLGAIITEEGDGMFYEPEGEEPADFTEWNEVPIGRLIHVHCLENYCLGALTEAAVARRSGEA